MNFEHEQKVDQCDQLLSGLINQVKEDYLLNGGMESRDTIE